MKPLLSLRLLLQSLTWLDIAKKDKTNAADWHERDLDTAAIFHRMWMDETWPA